MTKIKMKAPEGISGMTVDGYEIRVTDGFAEVELSIVPVLASHGFTTTLVHSEDTRQLAVNQLMLSARQIIENLPNDALTRMIQIPDESKITFWQKFGDDLTQYPEAEAKLKAEAEAKLKAEAEAKLKAEAEAKAKLEIKK